MPAPRRSHTSNHPAAATAATKCVSLRNDEERRRRRRKEWLAITTQVDDVFVSSSPSAIIPCAMSLFEGSVSAMRTASRHRQTNRKQRAGNDGSEDAQSHVVDALLRNDGGERLRAEEGERARLILIKTIHRSLGRRQQEMLREFSTEETRKTEVKNVTLRRFRRPPIGNNKPCPN